MITVLVAGFSWPPETFLARLFRGLAAADFRLTLAARQRPEPAWLAHPNIDWLATPDRLSRGLPQLAANGLRAGLTARADVKRLARHLPANKHARLVALQQWLPFAGRRWDVVYFPWNSGAIRYLPLFDLGMPVVVSCRGAQVNIAPHNPRRAAHRAGLVETLGRATAVHCVSDAIAREARPYGLDPAKARVIRPAVDPTVFCPEDGGMREDGRFRIVTTGSLIWRKGYEIALLAVRQLVDAGVPVQFDIIGDGPERQRVIYTIDDLGLHEHVTLHGRVSPGQVVARLQQADAFLLTSLSEGISNAVLEAMACELPVVTSDCGGMREAVTQGVEGMLVPVGDAHATAAALVQLAQDAALRTRMGRAGRRRILRDFTLDGQVAQFGQLLHDAVEAGPATAVETATPFALRLSNSA